MTEEAGDDDLGNMWGMGTSVHTHYTQNPQQQI